jgi:hypothetical protein
MDGAMVCNNDYFLSGNARTIAANKFGQNTSVVLPSSHPIDTTPLNLQRMSIHSSNNCFGVEGSMAALPGVKDGLNQYLLIFGGVAVLGSSIITYGR